MSLQAEIAASDPLKAFSSTLDALAGFGEELHIEARKTQFIMSALNMSMTGQAIIRVSPRFFASYSLRRPVIETPRGRIKADSLKCRVLLKTLRQIFRKNQNIASPLERCEMNLVEGSNTAENPRLHLKLICQNGVTKTHSLLYADTVPAQQLFTKDTHHQFTVEPGLIADFLHHFHPKVVDVALECTPSSVKVRSYYSETSRLVHADEKVMHTEFTINSSAFLSYGVKGSVQIAFNLKEFRTVLTYAAELQSPLKAFFDEPGKPIVFAVQQPDAIHADFAVMTHPDDPVESQLSNNLSGYSFRSGVS